MRWRAVRVTTLLLSCGILSLAVGWACALWAPDTPFPEQTVVAPGTLRYPRSVPSDWPEPFLSQRSRSFGSSFLGAAAHVEPGEITKYDHTNAVGQSVFQYGWPLRTLEYEARLYMLHPPPPPPAPHPIHFVGDAGQVPSSLVPSEHRLRRLPLRPIWTGLVVNTLVYAATLWLLIAAPVVLRSFLRRRRCLCPSCGYPAGASRVCTECGHALSLRPVG